MVNLRFIFLCQFSLCLHFWSHKLFFWTVNFYVFVIMFMFLLFGLQLMNVLYSVRCFVFVFCHANMHTIIAKFFLFLFFLFTGLRLEALIEMLHVFLLFLVFLTHIKLLIIIYHIYSTVMTTVFCPVSFYLSMHTINNYISAFFYYLCVVFHHKHRNFIH